ncbi:MAG: hypothetical protein IPP32_03775 [Bacteroidetes bacterium]|nr:hypothetical protein [Bacteroidota bacterium]
MRQLTKLSLISVLIASMLYFSACHPQKKIAGNYTYETECMGTEMDGSQTLKAWGYGKNRVDAVEQAKKNAVRDVLFKGIRNGKTECNVKPVVFDVNAQEKYEDFFNKFFADGGDFTQYVNQKDEPLIPKVLKDRKAADTGVEYGVIVRVLRAELKKRMIAENIVLP